MTEIGCLFHSQSAERGWAADMQHVCRGWCHTHRYNSFYVVHLAWRWESNGYRFFHYTLQKCTCHGPRKFPLRTPSYRGLFLAHTVFLYLLYRLPLQTAKLCHTANICSNRKSQLFKPPFLTTASDLCDQLHWHYDHRELEKRLFHWTSQPHSHVYIIIVQKLSFPGQPWNAQPGF